MHRFIRLLFLLAVLALGLPFWGPVLDHHFAERHHVHILPGHLEMDHAHPYQMPHRHHDSYPPAGGPGPKVGFLVPYDGSSQGAPVLAVHDRVAKAGFPEIGDNLLLGSALDRVIPAGASIPPPSPPPLS